MIDEIVNREPINLEDVRAEIDEIFNIQNPATVDQLLACNHVQELCHQLAQAMTELVPEGRERLIAINNILAAALWARHGITRKQIVICAVPPPNSEMPTSCSRGPSGAIGPSLACDASASG